MTIEQLLKIQSFSTSEELATEFKTLLEREVDVEKKEIAKDIIFALAAGYMNNRQFPASRKISAVKDRVREYFKSKISEIAAQKASQAVLGLSIPEQIVNAANSSFLLSETEMDEIYSQLESFFDHFANSESRYDLIQDIASGIQNTKEFVSLSEDLDKELSGSVTDKNEDQERLVASNLSGSSNTKMFMSFGVGVVVGGVLYRLFSSRKSG